MKTNLEKLVLTGILIAAGVALPIAFHAIPNAGSIFLPMHIPIFICGLLCGFPYGFICGILTPLLSSLLTGMPPAAYLPAMLCELATYGLVSSILIKVIKTPNRYVNLYACLIGAMLCGRIVYGILNSLIFRVGSYSLQLWVTSAFITSLPGIFIQLVFIPAIVMALEKAKLTKN